MNAIYQASLVNRHIRRFTGRYLLELLMQNRVDCVSAGYLPRLTDLTLVDELTIGPF